MAEVTFKPESSMIFAPSSAWSRQQTFAYNTPPLVAIVSSRNYSYLLILVSFCFLLGTHNLAGGNRRHPLACQSCGVFDGVLHEVIETPKVGSPCPSDLLPMIVSPALHAIFPWPARKIMGIARLSNNGNRNPEIYFPPCSLVMS